MKTFQFKPIEGYTIEGMYPKYGTGTFKILMQDSDYYGEMIFEVGGNVQGSELIGSIIDIIDDMDIEPDMTFEENKKHVVLDDEGFLVGVKLYNAEGKELFIDAQYDVNQLKHVIVGIVMIDYQIDK